MAEPAALITPLKIERLGLRSYAEIWELQRKLQRALINGNGVDTLLLCEHRPVITLGTSTKTESLLRSRADLDQAGIEIFEIERGGDITYHGPGQIVAYPIINLSHKRRDVHWYMRGLEEVIMRVLRDFNLESQRIPGRTGVWAQDNETTAKNRPRKIASIGVRISRWCTMHGFALNVLDVSAGFQNINPCGFTDIIVTSMEQERSYQSSTRQTPYTIAEVEPMIEARFCEVFDYSPQR